MRSFDFSVALLWIRGEGIPLTSNHPHVARRALAKIGRVITFDNASLQDGPKEFLQAKVQVELDKPLSPGYFYEYQVGHFQRVDFRYEEIFNFCKNCGKLGHKTRFCRISQDEAHSNFGRRMRKVCITHENIMVHHP